MPQADFPVMTGHAQGVITLNASEADVIYRETTRVKMGENCRTLLGHFRHESGHYYFDLMQHLHPELIDEFRELFGDERQDYSEALKRHYNDGAPQNWADFYVSFLCQYPSLGRFGTTLGTLFTHDGHPRNSLYRCLGGQNQYLRFK